MASKLAFIARPDHPSRVSPNFPGTLATSSLPCDMRFALSEHSEQARSLPLSVPLSCARRRARSPFFCAVRQTSSLNDQAQQTSLNFVCWSSPASMLAMQPSYHDVWRACSPHAGRQSKASKLAAETETRDVTGRAAARLVSKIALAKASPGSASCTLDRVGESESWMQVL